MEHETEILQNIKRIVSEARAFEWAVEQVSALLKSRAGAKLLLVAADKGGQGAEILRRQEVREFLAGPETDKLLYAAPLVNRHKTVGKLVAAFANPVFSTEATRRIAEFTGEQLGGLLGRERLVLA